jgi:hypothetical protein
MAVFIIISILSIQLLLTLKKMIWGNSIMLFNLLVFPNEMSISPTSDISLVKLSILLAVFFTLISTQKLNKKINYRYYIGILGFLSLIMPTYLLVGEFGSFNERLAKFVFNFITYEFLGGVVIFLSIKNEDDFKFFIKIILISLATIGIYGLFEFLTDSNPFLYWIKSLKSDNYKIIEYSSNSEMADGVRFGMTRRIQSTNWHPIAYGGILSMLFFITIYYYNENKIFAILCGLVAILNILLTFSRAPWVSTILGGLLYIFLIRKDKLHKNGVKKFLFYSLSFLMLTILLVSSYIFLIKTNIGGSSIEMRISQSTYLLDLIQSKLITGFGPNAVNQYLATNGRTELFGFESIVFVYMFNFGILGILALIYIYMTTLKLIKIYGNSINKILFKCVLVSHLTFVIISGEIRTFRIFWLIYSMFLAISLIEKKNYGRKNI